MDFAQDRDVVTINYSIRHLNGDLFDAFPQKKLLRIRLGDGILFRSIEKIVFGMKIGDIKTVTLNSNEIFDHSSEGIEKIETKVAINNVPNHIKKEVGQKIEISDPESKPIKVTITDVQDDYIVIASNIVVKDEDLVVKIELVDIEDDDL